METVSRTYADNDGRFPDESFVKVKYPLTADHELGNRADWPWLPGVILGQCGPDEWHVLVDDEELAEPNTDDPDGEPWYPACFRDSSEIRDQVSDSPSEEGQRS